MVRTPSSIAVALFTAVGGAAGVGLAGAGLAEAQDGLTRPKKGLSLQRVAERQRDPDRGRLDQAIRLLKNGAFPAAAMALHRFRSKQKVLRDEARYNLAKALYRMRVYRSALHYFTGLLAKGPKGRFYQSSLEWCLFISRKMKDDDAVNEVIARYGADTFPPEYRDEFSFRLARFHFNRALAIERGELGRPEKPRVKETETGRKSIQGDVFGDLFADDQPAAPAVGESDRPKAPPPSAPPRRSGAISLDTDLFGDPVPPKKTKPKKKRRRRKKRAKKKMPGIDEPWYLTAEEHTEAAERLVAQVDPDSKYGSRAKFLQGVLLYKADRANEALAAFKEVVRATRPGQPQASERLRQMAFFQLARTHFGAEQPSFSLFYYDKVDRDSYAWLDALYEGSWAEFRLGNYEKALGNLLTLHAPFFSDTYYPESLILKAVVYYENCRYPEAKTILADFLDRYQPVHDELKRLTSKKQAADKYYEDLGGLREKADAARKSSDTIFGQVVRIALSDPALERLDKAYREVEDEIGQLERKSQAFMKSGLFGELSKVLENTRKSVAQSAGRAVKAQLEREQRAINQLIKQALRIRIETARSEQERIESQLRRVQQRPKRLQKEFVEWTDDEKLVWPFDGEYWRDELGTYELTLAHSCR